MVEETPQFYKVNLTTYIFINYPFSTEADIFICIKISYGY